MPKGRKLPIITKEETILGQVMPRDLVQIGPKAAMEVPAEVVMAVGLYLRGWKQNRIAMVLGKNRHTISAWFLQYDEYIQSQFKQQVAIDAVLGELFPKAVAAYHDTLEGEHKGLKFTAAKDVLDRVMGPAGVSQQPVAPTFNVTFTAHPGEELQ